MLGTIGIGNIRVSSLIIFLKIIIETAVIVSGKIFQILGANF